MDNKLKQQESQKILIEKLKQKKELALKEGKIIKK